ncbi:hypothetical protein L2D01_08725 [Hyphomonadaceae bacterium ML37]|nr:hypothetical protein L2D01_08725 [Hyphomonadaceae bacterium ML37]
MTFKPGVERVLEVMSRKGYRVYDTPSVDWNLNIIGVRASPPSGDRFDDTLLVLHRFLGQWDITYYPITADPSSRYLRSPINQKGTAILKEGQYISTYKIDIHNRGRPGAHKALCQRLGQVVVYRDNNRDDVLDMLNPQSGMFGINIHRGPMNGNMDTANSIYSAGCQVFADRRHFEEFMLKCEHGMNSFGNAFTYTLLLQSDFD